MNELRAALIRELALRMAEQAAIEQLLATSRAGIAEAIEQIRQADADERADSLSETLYAANQLRRARLARAGTEQ